ASPPAARTSWAVCFPSATRRAARTTAAPSWAKRTQAARPMPELPPVTKATLPVIVPAIGALLLWLMALFPWCPAAAERPNLAAVAALSASWPFVEKRSGGNEIGELKPLGELAEDTGQPGQRFCRPWPTARQSVEADCGS